jgi:hypothetical protein
MSVALWPARDAASCASRDVEKGADETGREGEIAGTENALLKDECARRAGRKVSGGVQA